MFNRRLHLDGPAWPAEDDLPTEPRHDENIQKRTVPSSFTWRNKGLLYPPQNQGSCGSCWAFPFASQLEFLYKEYTGELVKFSEQYLIECTMRPWCGCAGGNFKTGAQHVMAHQYMPTEEAYGEGFYQAFCNKNPTCMKEGKNGFSKLWLTDYLPL